MKISEFKNEEAIELLADIIEPTAAILGDAEIRKLMISVKNGKITKIKAIANALRLHKKEIIEILARLDGQDPKKYSCNVITIPQKILEIINDEELADFFGLQVQMMESESSGLATETTEVKEN